LPLTLHVAETWQGLILTVCFDPAGRDAVPQRSLVPIRRDHGRFPLDFHHSADVRDLWRRQQIQLPVHAEGAPAPHHDQVHQSLP
jgi:hypothetical protein